ncbi:4'-phosphopantetheine phosphatase [Wyeomyia smithii]|uniref:4'-phosphopantetheine phosphatase n=1 Tax=Wyeomyia smithii TaxID=174621 RepID=UPI0024681BA8|nr:4'-phosphopantetheine phosphatase [Wyeomyia smithii]XP_055531558.1 4'-phosphopantetheine phosphatase [Wyeomyia smithii]
MSRPRRFNLLQDYDGYNPDTLNLLQDSEAKDYWFQCFIRLVWKFEQQAAKSQSSDPTAVDRAAQFRKHYLEQLEQLKDDDRSSNREPLAIRNLLELNEASLRLYGFDDPWKEQKRIENEASIKKLSSRLQRLDELEDTVARWTEIIKGVLAGNMFDWGAQAVSQILESDKNFGLEEALQRIQQRPWLIDCLDQWLDRLQGPAHKCVTIFTDNSGIDIVLGIMPLARELLLRHTKVLLCANIKPALNDITFDELKEVVSKCCAECKVIRDAYETGMLKILGNEQNGPCLDFRLITHELCGAILESDLLIIVGMARALHTNLNAKFTCETLKLAVVKNEWLAKRLGGNTFSVICKYENV